VFILEQNQARFAITLGAAGMPDRAHSAYRNLLFGIVALQLDFINRDHS
jgi:hypothetical protein